MAHRPVEAERRAPVVYDEADAVEPERLEETVDVARVIDEAITDIGFVGAAHADQIGRDAAADAAHVRDYVAPQVGRRWIAVQKHDRIAAALVDVGHACAVHLDVANRERKIGGDRRRLLRIVVTHVGSLKLTVPGPPGGSVHALSGRNCGRRAAPDRSGAAARLHQASGSAASPKRPRPRQGKRAGSMQSRSPSGSINRTVEIVGEA